MKHWQRKAKIKSVKKKTLIEQESLRQVLKRRFFKARIEGVRGVAASLNLEVSLPEIVEESPAQFLQSGKNVKVSGLVVGLPFAGQTIMSREKQASISEGLKTNFWQWVPEEALSGEIKVDLAFELKAFPKRKEKVSVGIAPADLFALHETNDAFQRETWIGFFSEALNIDKDRITIEGLPVQRAEHRRKIVEGYDGDDPEPPPRKKR